MTGFEAVKRLAYCQRLKQAFGRDPLQCPRCGTPLWLWVIWHPDYGLLYDELARMQHGVYASTERLAPRSPPPNQAPAAQGRAKGYVQLPLFAG
jgi:hypothetical protein